MFLRKLFRTPTSTPKPALYLETGCIPIRYLIKGKRIMYLHHILTREENALIKQVFRAQEGYPGKGDWCQVVREDLDSLGLVDKSFDEIALKSKESLRTLVTEKMYEVALENLREESLKLSKLATTSYSKLEMQSYLTGDKLSTRLKQLAFRWRTKMIKVGWNYGKKESCPICLQADDTQNHLLECTYLNDANTMTDCDLNRNNYNLTQHMKRLEVAIRKRDIILEERKK